MLDFATPPATPGSAGSSHSTRDQGLSLSVTVELITYESRQQPALMQNYTDRQTGESMESDRGQSIGSVDCTCRGVQSQ